MNYELIYITYAIIQSIIGLRFLHKRDQTALHSIPNILFLGCVYMAIAPALTVGITIYYWSKK